MHSNIIPICPACGDRLVVGSHGALCPACMLQAVIHDVPAAAQGDENAKDNASALQQLLLESQITESKRRVEQFKPKGGAQPSIIPNP